VIWRGLYALVLWAALPLVLARLWWRGRREPGYRRAVAERFGWYRDRPAAKGMVPVRPLIWLHAVSLGETRAAAPLLERLARNYPECDFLVTHMTATGRQAAEQLFGGKATLAWLPYDYAFAVRRFLSRFQPRLGILIETEVWFNLVRCCRQAGIPLLLANARLSERSFRGYELLAPLAREAFSGLSAVAAQSNDDARRLQSLGARPVQVSGNLKFDVRASPALEALARQFRQRWGERRIFVAASTRAGEEQLLLGALASHPLRGALTVIVPRHPERFDEVEALVRGAGLSLVRRSAEQQVPAGCDVVLGDSMGEMAAYYGAADIAFVGGSLLAFGGQNLIEACAAGIPVLFGPHTYNFADVARAALAAGAARRVADAESLIGEVQALLADEPRRRAMGQAGRVFCEEHRGATDRIAALAEQLLRFP
jgi:3-deoxy-D-manno-octulosonic-acid transferase